MSKGYRVIEGEIVGVTMLSDGTAHLHIESKKLKKSKIIQIKLTLLNPPENIDAAIGTKLWGNAVSIVVNNRTWARRVGPYTIRLVEGD